MQKIIIAVLATALIAVCSVWGYTTWQAKQAQLPAPVATVPAAATPAVVPGAPGPNAPKGLLPTTEGATASLDEIVADGATAVPGSEVVEPAAEELQDGVHFEYEYVAPRTEAYVPIYNKFRDIDFLRKLPEIGSLDGLLTLPRPIKYVLAECGQINAFYAPTKGQIVLCYELVDQILTQGANIQVKENLGEDYSAQYLYAVVRFVMLHETGHALIDMLKLDSTGREEDAVDQLASTLMITFTSSDEPSEKIMSNLFMAASFFRDGDSGQYDIGAFADEHAFGLQRYFNLLCMVYGSDPGKYLKIVTSGLLPEARALRCEQETDRIVASWSRLFAVHIAPKHRMTPEQEAAKVEEIKRKQAENAPDPYLH